jgi:hypothetical protein
MSKRMFSASIVESDAFLDMPLTAQALYMHLVMNADNDGFVNPRRITRMVGGNVDDLNILVVKRFLLTFDSGVMVIKHWWINNNKRSDRHIPTSYQKELSELYIKDNKAYTKDTTEMAIPTEVDRQAQLPLATNGQPDADIWSTQSSAETNGNQFKTTVATNAKRSVREGPKKPVKRLPFNSRTAATTGSKIRGNGFADVDALYEDLRPLVNEKFHDWYCKVFFKLGREKVWRLASEAKADTNGDPKRLFSALLTRESGTEPGSATQIGDML